MTTATEVPPADWTQRLAAPLNTTTPLTVDEAATALRRVCDHKGGRRYQVQIGERDILVGYPRSDVTAPAHEDRSHLPVGQWLAAIRFPPREPVMTRPGEHPVEIRLTNWVLDGDRRLHTRDEYEELTDAIAGVVTAGT